MGQLCSDCGGLGIFLYARQADPDAIRYLMTLITVSMWAAAEGAAILSGIFAWAHILAKPGIEERRLRKVERRLAALERFHEQLKKTEKEFCGPSNIPLPVLGGRALFLALILALLSAALSTPAHAADPVCALFVDRTLSLDPEHRSEAMDLLYRSLRRLLKDLRCKERIVGAFLDEGPWAGC